MEDNPLNLFGQVTFRLLCHIDAVGGLIGKSGTIIRNLESDTRTKIRISKPVPNCLERVISLTGQAAFSKRITLEYPQSMQEAKEEFNVSEVQEALLRVFERILEVEGGGGRLVGCRLLAHVSQIGAVLGKGAKIVVNICKKTGAKVRVLPQDQLPPCANQEDVPIQLMGEALAVKKALVCVSSRLQDRSPTDISALETTFHANARFAHNFRPLTAPSCVYSEGIQKSHNLKKEDYRNKVVFRLLCPNDIVGGVIGSGGTLIKALETETGASIKIPVSIRGSSERVAIISASKEPESVSSAAQIALIRVFTRCVDVGIERGIIPGSRKRKITARLLVTSNQVDCLLDEVGKFASDISAESNAEIQLLAGDLVPNCASKNDNVVQIFGSYENVKNALFQLTSRIREAILCNAISDGIDKTMAAEIGQLSLLPRFENQSLEPVEIKITEEIVVPEQVFTSVYGKNGNNINCIREISGTTVVVEEPYPGKSDGKVIITGTHERIQIAKSILQAFVQSAP